MVPLSNDDFHRRTGDLAIVILLGCGLLVGLESFCNLLVRLVDFWQRSE